MYRKSADRLYAGSIENLSWALGLVVKDGGEIEGMKEIGLDVT
jgi:hypothetical protein